MEFVEFIEFIELATGKVIKNFLRANESEAN